MRFLYLGMSIHPSFPLSLQSNGQLTLSSGMETHPHLVGDFQLTLALAIGFWVKVSKLRCQGDPIEAHPIPIAVRQDQA